MSDKRTYTPYVPDDLVSVLNGDTDAAMLACKLNTFADEKGAVLVSFSYIANMWNWKDERRVKKAADKLDALQIWHYKKGDGRGHVTEWIKGANYATFVTIERVQNLQIKGTKIAPYNKEYNKDRLISAHARKINQSNFNFMEEFEQFWQAFFFGSYAKYEKEQSAYKERAAAAWHYLPENKRTRLLSDIKAGRRWDKTHWILWYVQNYEIPMQIWYELDPDLTANMVGGLIYVRYNGRGAYIKPEDKDAWLAKGAQMFNN